MKRNIEEQLKEDFEEAITQVSKDILAEDSPFSAATKPIIGLFIDIGFYLYQRGYEKGVIQGELVNESK